MPLCSWLLSSLLVSQIAGNPSVPLTVAPPTANSHGPAVPAATYPGTPTIGGVATPDRGGATPALAPATLPVRAVQPPAAPLRATTSQLVADALAVPSGSTITGQPVSLVSVVATAPERQRQIEAVHAYWRLAEAIGDYHCNYERQQRLARLRAENDEAAELRTARAIAAAQVHEAELQVTTAQHDLAEILLLAPGTPLPLPADLPLVGPYRTLFAELFAGRKAPQRARMLDQTLPLRNRAIESHAAALLAAEDALDAAIELQTSGQGRLAGVIAALDAHVRQQRAFLAAVCRYNHDIADYALVVVSPQTTPELLVGTLIKQNRPAGQPVTPLPTTATLPAAYQQPVFAPAAPASAAKASRLRHRPGRRERHGRALPRAKLRKRRSPLGSRNRAARFARRLRLTIRCRTMNLTNPAWPRRRNRPSPCPGKTGRAPPCRPRAQNRLAALRPTPAGSRLLQTAHRRLGDGDLSRFGRFAACRASRQTHGRLVRGPHSSECRTGFPARRFADGLGKAVLHFRGSRLRLIDCLRAAPSSGRANVVAAYWAARQIAAQYQSLVEQSQWLEALRPTAFRPKSPVADGDAETSHGPLGRRGRAGRRRGRLQRSQVRTRGPCRSWDRKESSRNRLRFPSSAGCPCRLRRSIALGLGGGWKRPFRSGNKRWPIRRRWWSKPMHRGRRQRPIFSPAGLPLSGPCRASRFRPVRLLLSCGV